MTPARGRVLVRRVETEETFAGGKIVLPESTRESLAMNQVEIVATGARALCGDEDCDRRIHMGGDGNVYHDFRGKTGDWALVAPRSLVESGTDGLYFVSQDDVIAVLSA